MNAVALFLAAAAALAQDTSGTLIPTGGGPPLEIASQDVRVRINNGIAVTTVTQVFRNNRPVALEAVYSFPVPNEASVSNFSMWINGKEVVGEVLERKEARRIYESITARRQDPGLLEQVSYKLFEMRVFPVPANGEQRVQIAYYQPVDYDSGYGTYVYPLEAKTKEHSRVTGTFKIDVEVASELPLRSVTSPSHRDELAVAEASPGRWRASVETPKGAIDRDFVLVYEYDRERTGVTLVPWKEKGKEGIFLLLLTAGRDLERERVPTNVVFLLDVSGSMGEQRKLQHAVAVVDGLLGSLEAGDRMNVVAFNIAPEAAFPDGSVEAGKENVARARAFLRDRGARGGTDLVPALEAAARFLRDDMPNALVLLSDGNATDSDDHSRFRRLLEGREKKVRIFSIGVGNEVNRPLLNVLAQATGGLSDFISSGDDVERKVSLLRTKMTHQVAEDLELGIEGVKAQDLMPARLPNLFKGQQIAVYGRYGKGGEAAVTLKGKLAGEARELRFPLEFPDEERDNPEVRRMWAWKRTDVLMEEVRARGESPARLHEIVKLGTEHSIMTPYTSFLVLENDAQYRQFGIEQRNARQIAEDRAAQERRGDRSTTARSPGHFGGGGGGSVELGFLGLLAALAAGRAIRKRAAR